MLHLYRVNPLESEDLYKFIVPNTNILYSTMRNLDYCVGATSFVSSCPPWLHRNSTPSSMRYPATYILYTTF